MATVVIMNRCRNCGKKTTRSARWTTKGGSLMTTKNGSLVSAFICTRCLPEKELRRINRANATKEARKRPLNQP